MKRLPRSLLMLILLSSLVFGCMGLVSCNDNAKIEELNKRIDEM